MLATTISDRDIGMIHQVDCRRWRKTAQLAKEGAITGLKLMTLNIQMAPKDGKRRCPTSP